MSSVFDGASLRAYRESLASVAPLDRETERDLARRWIDGDKRAGEKIVEACLPFVIAIALEYRRWGIPLEDIVQQGNLGLLRAAKKFDPEREVRLATYAAYWIRAEIREYVVRAYRVVRLGTTKAERRALRAYRTMERDPEELARLSGLSPERVELLMPLLAGREMSLDASGADTTPVVERMAAKGPDPEEAAGAQEVRDRAQGAVQDALRHLNERELLIVKERLMNDDPVTLQRLGEMLGVSKERVRQLEERARGKLRDKLAGLREHAQAM
ncbi:RNA polymerase sigma factor RpoD/SigA [Pendulispora albinea]|uniref:sigma-70 family RNA polymerase sigma factor n=1 Tax=Pendulispora albinea TaxID=2741071 RepID=UPI00374E0F86